MATNSAIQCKVDSCRYNDDAHCTLKEITVGKDCSCAKDCCETECLSFELD